VSAFQTSQADKRTGLRRSLHPDGEEPLLHRKTDWRLKIVYGRLLIAQGRASAMFDLAIISFRADGYEVSEPTCQPIRPAAAYGRRDRGFEIRGSKGPHELGCADACHCNVTSRQTPARCQRYLWSRRRQRKCRTIRSSRLKSAGHFVTDDRAHGGFVVFGSFTFRMGVIGPGNRSRERRSHGPTDRH